MLAAQTAAAARASLAAAAAGVEARAIVSGCSAALLGGVRRLRVSAAARQQQSSSGKSQGEGSEQGGKKDKQDDKKFKGPPNERPFSIAVLAVSVTAALGVAVAPDPPSTSEGEPSVLRWNPVYEFFHNLKIAAEESMEGLRVPLMSDIDFGKLPDKDPKDERPVLVLDLDGTLIYSIFARRYGWRNVKRPGVEGFISHISQFYEIVLFTCKDHAYADQVMANLDPLQRIDHRLYRTSCEGDSKHYKMKTIKDLNRDPSRIVWLEDSLDQVEESLRPNVVVMPPFNGDSEDRGLTNMIPFLEAVAMERVADVRQAIAKVGAHDTAHRFREMQRQKAAELEERPSAAGNASLWGGIAGGRGDERVRVFGDLEKVSGKQAAGRARSSLLTGARAPPAAKPQQKQEKQAPAQA